MVERLKDLTDCVGPYVKESASPLKPAVRSLVEALRNLFPQWLEAAAWRAQMQESYINKARITRPSILTRALAMFLR